MKYQQLGQSGLVVSRIGFGAMTFGQHEYRGFRANVGEREAREMVARALDSGINLFDTADVYAGGQSEEILGRALVGHRDDVVICTKAFFRSGTAVMRAGSSRRHLLSACEASLRRLGTDHVDLMLVHNFDPLTPLEETARALDDLQRQGKVRYTGVSNFHGWQVEKLLGIQQRLSTAPVVANQVYFSLLGRDIEHDVLPQASHSGVGLMTWGPLAGGYLAGKYAPTERRGGGRRDTFDFPPVDRDLGDRVVQRLKDLGEHHDASPAQVALAWTLSRPWISTVLVGASRMSQLESNLRAAIIPLTPEEISSLDELTAPSQRYPAWIQGGDDTLRRAIQEGWTPGD